MQNKAKKILVMLGMTMAVFSANASQKDLFINKDVFKKPFACEASKGNKDAIVDWYKRHGLAVNGNGTLEAFRATVSGPEGKVIRKADGDFCVLDYANDQTGGSHLGLKKGVSEKKYQHPIETKKQK